MSAKIIGILGDGQLARMSAIAAQKLGHSIRFYGENPSGPCAGLGEFHQGKWSDYDALMTFSQGLDVITLENEFISSEILHALEKGTVLAPSSQCFSKIENKFIEKETFRKLGIPTPSYALVKNFDQDFEHFVSKFGYPVMLKSSKGGYDGYGNHLARNLDEARVGFEKLGGHAGREIIVEAGVDFEREVATTVARNFTGDIAVYPVCDTIQENHMCNIVSAPSSLSADICKKVQELAKVAMEGIKAVGVFSFEFFITKDGQVLINESAPRPHNSAHYTMDACVCGQYENHIRAITGENLGETSLKTPAAVMLNLLGTQNGPAKLEGHDQFKKPDSIFFHIYGKEISRVGRKMGHVNLLGDDVASLIEEAKEIESKVRI